MKDHVNRTPEMLRLYRENRDCMSEEQRNNFVFDLSKENTIEVFNHWVVIKNDFPYDAVFELHHMLVPKRVFPDISYINDDEREELQEIKRVLSERYDGVLENLPRIRSVVKHAHLHVFTWKTRGGISGVSGE